MELLGGTRKLIKLFVRKKWPMRTGLQINRQLKFVRSALKHIRWQPQKLNCLRMDNGFKTANKVFGRLFV